MSDLADRVRIKPTEETQKLGLAGKEGQVFGWTTPSLTGVSVIGSTSEDYALNVHFDDLNAAFWFAEDLVEHVNTAAGTVITVEGVDKEWVRLPNRDWEVRPPSSSS